MRRKTSATLAVVLTALVGAIVVWYVARPEPGVRPGLTVGPVRTQPGVPAPQPRARPTTFPAARKWLSQHTYEDTRGRWISCYNIDADVMYDADEIVQFGTIRYDNQTRRSAPRIDGPKPRVDPADTDGDGLHDAWERGYFGKLDFGRWDDPDGDGFPNGVEYDRRTSPVAIDLMDPKLKPKAFIEGVGSFRSRRSFSTGSRAFWVAQAKAAARVKKGDKGMPPAVEGFVWQLPAPKPRPPGAKPAAPTALEIRIAQLARGALSAKLDSDADGLLDAWESHYIGDLSQGRQDDPDGDGFPNVIEWYRSTHPLKADLMDPALRPAELESMPFPQTPWDLCWDIHSRKFWEIQEKLAAELKTRDSAASGSPAGGT